MSSSIDDVTRLSVFIIRGPDHGWLVGLVTLDSGEPAAVDFNELRDMPTKKSLMETEILLTAWLAGRGFVHISPWRTNAENDSETHAIDVRAEFIRK
jgi:hypothetical protein